MKLALIIEDDPDLQRRFRILLEQHGLRVILAADGKTGIEAVREHKPDIVCVDLMLPVVSGFDVCEVLRAEPEFSRLPLLVVSGRSSPADRQRAADLGVSAYLTKPVKGAVMAKEVLRLLAEGQ